jgi:predicted NBD/HSP70 family sugar kinase
MLREMTDSAVLHEVFNHRRVTRVDLAGATGISRPTVFESVRRLENAGVLRPAGGQTTGGRGRVATFYELAPDTGFVLALEINQLGVHARGADLTGQCFHDWRQEPVRAGDTSALTDTIRTVFGTALQAGTTRHQMLRAVALSMANPVDPATGEVVALPGTPFPEGPQHPAQVLADLTTAPVLVDNDVNWAALAERRLGAGQHAASFVYIHIGAGLGMGFYVGDHLVRGAHGLAGEIGYLSAATPSGEPSILAAALARQGFGHPDAPSTDVPAVLNAIDAAQTGNHSAAYAVGQITAIIARIVTDTCAIVDPELVILGGPIGRQPALLEPIRDAVKKTSPLPIRVELGSLGDAAPLHGALGLALDEGRAQLITVQG